MYASATRSEPELARRGLPGQPREQLRWWGLLWVAWTSLAAAQAAVATVALHGGLTVFVHSALLFGTTAWVAVATTPLVVWLARRLEWRGWRAAPAHATLVIGLHATMLLIVATIHTAWWRLALAEFARQRVGVPFHQTLIARFDAELFIYLAIVLAVHAADNWRRAGESMVDAARAEAKLVATRLHVLMMQLQPHFLFNTLHSISELVHRDGAIARRTLAHLRDLLRFSLDRSTQGEVPLREELRALETYMEIQEMRFGDRLAFDLAIGLGTEHACVPCLVLQPLVENAIRHGTAPLGRRGHIIVTTARVGDRLELRVQDNGRGVGSANREGQGLRNTRVRLGELYGDRQRLALENLEGGGTVAIVTIPFRDARGIRVTPIPRAGAPGGEADERGQGSRIAAIRWALLVLGGWTMFGLLWTAQAAVIATITSAPSAPLLPRMTVHLGNAWAWGLMTGIVVLVVRGWPARRIGWPGLAIHAALALAVSLVLMIGRWVATGATGPLITLAQSGWLGWDVMTYCVIAAFTHAAYIVKERRDRDVRLAWLDGEVSRAELDVLKWHLRPGFLIETLDDIADVSTTDPERADDMTTSLGALLRLIMQHVGTPDSTVARELEMARAFLDIQRMRRGSQLVAAVSADPEALDVVTPGVLLLPMVEELVGARAEDPRAEGPLEVTVDVRRAHGTLVLTMRCVGAGCSREPGGRLDAAATLGGAESEAVRRVRSRLVAAYGEDYRLITHSSAKEECVIVLELPHRPAGEGKAHDALQRAGGER